MNIEGLKAVEDALVAHWRNTHAMSRVGTAGKCNFPADTTSTQIFEIISNKILRGKKYEQAGQKMWSNWKLLLQFQDISWASPNWEVSNNHVSRWCLRRKGVGGSNFRCFFPPQFWKTFSEILNRCIDRCENPMWYQIFFEQFSSLRIWMRERDPIRR